MSPGGSGIERARTDHERDFLALGETAEQFIRDGAAAGVATREAGLGVACFDRLPRFLMLLALSNGLLVIIPIADLKSVSSV